VNEPLYGVPPTWTDGCRHVGSVKTNIEIQSLMVGPSTRQLLQHSPTYRPTTAVDRPSDRAFRRRGRQTQSVERRMDQSQRRCSASRDVRQRSTVDSHGRNATPCPALPPSYQCHIHRHAHSQYTRDV